MENSPCINCQDRKVTGDFNCHSVCERYKGFSERREQDRKARAEHHRQNELINAPTSAKTKFTKRKFMLRKAKGK